MAYCIVRRKDFSDRENCPWCREAPAPEPMTRDDQRFIEAAVAYGREKEKEWGD